MIQNKGLTGFVLALSFWCLYQGRSAIAAETTTTVSAREVIRWQSLGEPFVFVDLRPPLEFNIKHARGAVNMPSFGFDSTADSLPHEARIVLCAAGPDSTEVVSTVLLLRSKGYSRAFALDGGLSSWEAAGLPLMTSIASLPAAAENAISVEELARMIAEGKNLTVIDVRPTTADVTDRIPKAVPLAPAEVVPAMAKSAHPTDLIVVVDDGDGAARNAAEELRRKGFLETRYLDGGVRAWSEKTEIQPPSGNP